MIPVILAVAALLATDVPADEGISVNVVGILRTGIVAIGGETTGTTITAKGVTWELDLGKNAELRQMVKKLDGKKVTVRGTLERRAGVEDSQQSDNHWIAGSGYCQQVPSFTAISPEGQAGLAGTNGSTLRRQVTCLLLKMQSVRRPP